MPEPLKYPPLLILLVLLATCSNPFHQKNIPVAQFTLSVPNPASHSYHVELNISRFDVDTLILKMPQWTPGYYQIMNYCESIENLSVKNKRGDDIPFSTVNCNTWRIPDSKNRELIVNYDINTTRKFVANSYVDSTHAYIVPANTFMYVDGYLDNQVHVMILKNPKWSDIASCSGIATGTYVETGASHFDLIYDCPIMMGDLEELPSFEVNGAQHHFIGYKMGSFDKEVFVSSLEKVVRSAIEIIGDIPYRKYTFLAIGPGRGGIEHLNCTTVSFDGNQLQSQEAINRVLAFLAHEYFHHYNVKRIRPFELGPFDYDKENRTNLLWVSEGLTVYYQYLILRRAGLIDEQTLFDFLGRIIIAYENDNGKSYQTLQQASYYTWQDGPFGTQEGSEDRSISFYDKGAIVGILLDFEIRNATQNDKSLDDVMRYLYWLYYKKLKRGFTDAEFQEACESIAGTSLTPLFEYVYTTKELDYNKYFNHAGLKVDKELSISDNRAIVSFITRLEERNELQNTILRSWQGE